MKDKADGNRVGHMSMDLANETAKVAKLEERLKMFEAALEETNDVLNGYANINAVMKALERLSAKVDANFDKTQRVRDCQREKNDLQKQLDK